MKVLPGTRAGVGAASSRRARQPAPIPLNLPSRKSEQSQQTAPPQQQPQPQTPAVSANPWTTKPQTIASVGSSTNATSPLATRPNSGNGNGEKGGYVEKDTRQSLQQEHKEPGFLKFCLIASFSFLQIVNHNLGFSTSNPYIT